MKLTKTRLKQIIKEELKAELKDLKHQGMNEGKLSSVLMERYGISEEDAKGTVLWHSLNENGEISVYDMKFGNTIVRNLLAEDIESTLEEGHNHPKRDDDDEERGKKK